MNDGYIKLYKKMLKWQWYKDSNTLHVFISLLLDANFEDSKAGFEVIKRGQVLTSVKRLHELTGLTTQQIRTSLSKLEKSQEINKQTTNRYSIITINNYNDYQINNKQLTNKQQTNNNIKEYKEEKEYKESISKDIQKKYFENLKVNAIFYEFLKIRKKLKAVNSDLAIQKLINKLNQYEDDTKYAMIENSVINSWKGVYPLKQQINKKSDIELPNWFDKEIEREKLSDEERRELEAIKNGTYRA